MVWTCGRAVMASRIVRCKGAVVAAALVVATVIPAGAHALGVGAVSGAATYRPGLNLAVQSRDVAPAVSLAGLEPDRRTPIPEMKVTTKASG